MSELTESVPPAPVVKPSPLWKKALPFAIALALIGFTVSRIDLPAFARNIAAVNAPGFMLFAAAFVFGLLTADAFASAIVYRRAVAPVTFREFWVLRGASYLMSILNHHVGQAFVTYYVSRTHRVSLARIAGATLLVYASWMGLLLLAGAGAMVMAGWPLLRPVLALGAGVVYLVVIAAKPAPLARIQFLAPLFEAGFVGHVVALVVRIPHFFVLFVGTWLPFWFFGVKIPLGAALAFVPIMMVAATLPITPQGVGTRALLAVTFFARYAPGATPEEQAAAIAASMTSFEVAFTMVEAVLGLVLLRRAMPALEASKAQS
jgi:hypothetical protein